MPLQPSGVPSRAEIQGAIDEAVLGAFTDTGWVNLTLGAGWTAINAVQYRVINGVTYLRGTAVRNSGSNTTIATLPVGARPGGFTVNLLARVDSAGMPLAISTAGGIVISGAYTNGGQVQLSGQSFPVG